MGGPETLSVDTVLDHVLFKLTTTRTRCEVILCADDIAETLTTGLVKPFVTHVQAAQEQIANGAHIIRLEPRRAYRARGTSVRGDGRFPWFTKGTVERVVRFVSSPELLERIIAIDVEILQLEEALRQAIDENYYDTDKAYGRLEGLLPDMYEAPPSPTGRRPMSPGGRSPSPSRHLRKQGSRDNLQQEFGDEDSELARKRRRALEGRRTMLRREQGVAFARATAAGFIGENIPPLAAFAECFGAMRLREACNKFAALLRRKEDGAVEARPLADNGDSVAGQGAGSMGAEEDTEFDVRSAPGSTIPQPGKKAQMAKREETQSEDGRMMAGSRPWLYGKPNSYADSETSSYYDRDEGMDGTMGRYESVTDLATMEEGPSTSGGDESVGDNSEPVIAPPQSAYATGSGPSGESSGDSELTDVRNGNSGSPQEAGGQGGKNRASRVRGLAGQKLEVTIPIPESPWDKRNGARQSPLSAVPKLAGYAQNGEVVAGSPVEERENHSDGEPLLRRRSSWPLLPDSGSSESLSDQASNHDSSLRLGRSIHRTERGRMGPIDYALGGYGNGAHESRSQQSLHLSQSPVRSPGKGHSGLHDLAELDAQKRGDVSPAQTSSISPLLDYRRRQSPLVKRRSTLLVNGVEYVPAYGSEAEFPSPYGLASGSPTRHDGGAGNLRSSGSPQRAQSPPASATKSATNGQYRSFSMSPTKTESANGNRQINSMGDAVQANGSFSAHANPVQGVPIGPVHAHGQAALYAGNQQGTVLLPGGQYAYAIRNPDGSLTMVPAPEQRSANQSPYVILPLVGPNSPASTIERADNAHFAASSPAASGAGSGGEEEMAAGENSAERTKKSPARRKSIGRKALRRVVVIKKVQYVKENEKTRGPGEDPLEAGAEAESPGGDARPFRPAVVGAGGQEGPPAKRAAVGHTRRMSDGGDNAMEGVEFEGQDRGVATSGDATEVVANGYVAMEIGNGSHANGAEASSMHAAVGDGGHPVEIAMAAEPEVAKPLVEEFVLLGIADRGGPRKEEQRFLGEEDLRGMEQTSWEEPSPAFSEAELFGSGFVDRRQETSTRDPVFLPEAELSSQPASGLDAAVTKGGAHDWAALHGGQNLSAQEGARRGAGNQSAHASFMEEPALVEAGKPSRMGEDKHSSLFEEELRGPPIVARQQDSASNLNGFLEEQMLASGLHRQSYFPSSQGMGMHSGHYEPEPLLPAQPVRESQPARNQIIAAKIVGDFDFFEETQTHSRGREEEMGRQEETGHEEEAEVEVEAETTDKRLSLGGASDRSAPRGSTGAPGTGVRQRGVAPAKQPPWGSGKGAQSARQRSSPASSEKIVTDAQLRAQERLKMRQQEAAKRREEEKQRQEAARTQRLTRIVSSIESLEAKGTSRLTASPPARRATAPDGHPRRQEASPASSRLAPSKSEAAAAAPKLSSPMSRPTPRAASTPMASRLYAPTVSSQQRLAVTASEKSESPLLRTRRASDPTPSKVSPAEKRGTSPRMASRQKASAF